MKRRGVPGCSGNGVRGREKLFVLFKGLKSRTFDIQGVIGELASSVVSVSMEGSNHKIHVVLTHHRADQGTTLCGTAKCAPNIVPDQNIIPKYAAELINCCKTIFRSKRQFI